MQLILTHADLELALIESLRSKGMTAFEPGKASVEFTFKRGTKELQCVLDTEPKVANEAAPKAVSGGTEAPVAQATPVAETEQPAQADAAPVETPKEDSPADAVDNSEADNLFD